MKGTNLLQTLVDTTSYHIYAILSCGWYVVNKATKDVTRFDFNKNTYDEVVAYAESI